MNTALRRVAQQQLKNPVDAGWWKTTPWERIEAMAQASMSVDEYQEWSSRPDVVLRSKTKP